MERTTIEGHDDIHRNRRWKVADGEVFCDVTGPLGLAGPVLVHLEAPLAQISAAARPIAYGRSFGEALSWGQHLAELLGGHPSVVMSVPYADTDRAATPFIDIDGAKVCVALGATTKRSRAALRAFIIGALDAITTPADERGAP